MSPATNPPADDPTEAICLKASQYPEVDEGTACTQSSFKARKKAFLYIGPQGGRFKAMFKLKDSMAEATELAQAEPNRYEVGKNAWVTARFSAEQPMPEEIWQRWLDESYELTVGTGTRKKAKKKAAGS